MSKEIELLNCPFCGCVARDKLFLGERIAFIDCVNKDCAIYNEAIPIEKWQTRTAPKSTEAEGDKEIKIESLKADLRYVIQYADRHSSRMDAIRASLLNDAAIANEKGK